MNGRRGGGEGREGKRWELTGPKILQDNRPRFHDGRWCNGRHLDDWVNGCHGNWAVQFSRKTIAFNNILSFTLVEFYFGRPINSSVVHFFFIILSQFLFITIYYHLFLFFHNPSFLSYQHLSF